MSRGLHQSERRINSKRTLNDSSSRLSTFPPDLPIDKAYSSKHDSVWPFQIFADRSCIFASGQSSVPHGKMNGYYGPWAVGLGSTGAGGCNGSGIRSVSSGRPGQPLCCVLIRQRVKVAQLSRHWPDNFGPVGPPISHEPTSPTGGISNMCLLPVQ
ncbi:unnamed protein product [Protopolystoma xenopodis]|uniref:Uncharacterized protein n=1 Tax=Protopolystoma xenopodis TaxID=117903 RepID=A0A3S5AI15_9PLAT|nr:unnamed protein product [Protopolystoma xenopodis]